MNHFCFIRVRPLFVPLFGCLIAFACSPGPSETAPNVLATVGGTPISQRDVDFTLMGEHGGRRITSKMREDALADLIRFELLFKEGERLDLAFEEKHAKVIGTMELRLKHYKRLQMARLVHNSQIAPKAAAATEAEGQAYFRTHTERIRTELHLAHIVFENAAQADGALERIRKGESFEDVARAHRFERSGDGEKPTEKGGKAPWDIGYLRWDRLPLSWHESLYSLEKGQVSPVVTGKHTGIRIFKLIDRRSNDEITFEDVETALMIRLRDEKKEAIADQYVEDLKRKYKVVSIHDLAS